MIHLESHRPLGAWQDWTPCFLTPSPPRRLQQCVPSLCLLLSLQSGALGELGRRDWGLLGGGGCHVRVPRRTAQKHCCVSYLKERSCVAGVVGAKAGEACGAEDGDGCSVSLYQASPDDRRGSGVPGLRRECHRGCWGPQQQALRAGPAPGIRDAGGSHTGTSPGSDRPAVQRGQESVGVTAPEDVRASLQECAALEALRYLGASISPP